MAKITTSILRGSEAASRHTELNLRAPVETHEAFQIFEIRVQGDRSVFSRVVGYRAYYKGWFPKREQVLIESKSRRELNRLIKETWATWGVQK